MSERHRFYGSVFDTCSNIENETPESLKDTVIKRLEEIIHDIKTCNTYDENLRYTEVIPQSEFDQMFTRWIMPENGDYDCKIELTFRKTRRI